MFFSLGVSDVFLRERPGLWILWEDRTGGVPSPPHLTKGTGDPQDLITWALITWPRRCCAGFSAVKLLPTPSIPYFGKPVTKSGPHGAGRDAAPPGQAGLQGFFLKSWMRPCHPLLLLNTISFPRKPTHCLVY